jgi:hypothetical protein
MYTVNAVGILLVIYYICITVQYVALQYLSIQIGIFTLVKKQKIFFLRHKRKSIEYIFIYLEIL